MVGYLEDLLALIILGEVEEELLKLVELEELKVGMVEMD